MMSHLKLKAEAARFGETSKIQPWWVMDSPLPHQPVSGQQPASHSLDACQLRHEETVGNLEILMEIGLKEAPHSDQSSTKLNPRCRSSEPKQC